MDIAPVITHAIGMMVWFIPFALLLIVLKSPWAKGHIGEWLVRLVMHRKLDARTYRSLHNVTLDTPDGTTQIDHVLLSVYGVFVLETKHMRGWIFGSERQAQWTQKLYRRTFRFQNPLRQNYKHVKAIEVTLGVSPAHVHSVISFIGDSTFKTEMPANVTQRGGFVRYIRMFTQPVFSAAEVDAMLLTLQARRREPTRATHREHVVQLRQRKEARKS